MSRPQKSMASSTNDEKKAPVELLECGTSLAEHEYWAANDVAPVDDGQRNHPKEGGNDSTLLQQGGIDSIESLRSLLAADTLHNNNNSNVTTFTSPFERIILPQQHSKKGTPTPPNNSTSKKSSRYYQVPLIYCDQTASNRAVKSIENYIQNVCLPLYGNTHTNTSLTGSQSTAFVAEARQCIAEQTNAKVTGKASLDVVLFA